jgi:putative transposase
VVIGAWPGGDAGKPVHRAVKRIKRPIQGFKDFRCARITLGGVELMHMIRKGQMRDDGRGLSAAQQFYMLAE